MTLSVGKEKDTMQKILLTLSLASLVLLGVYLSQEAWRGQEMLDQLRSDCDRRGGVMLEHKNVIMGGTNYKCVERLD